MTDEATPPVAPPPAHWWSDALNDPWRDPNAEVVLTRPQQPASPAPPVEPQAQGARPRTGWLIAGAAALAGLLSGLLGGALGVRFGGGEPAVARPAPGTFALAPQQPAAESLARVAKMVLPSVVTVRVPVNGGTAIGSGFIFSPGGPVSPASPQGAHILTNDHVVSGGAGMTTVIFDDGTSVAAEVVGTDPESDVAVLHITGSGGLKAAQLGDSDLVAVGDQVVAVGSPLALRGTVTAGIVSAVDRTLATQSPGTTRYYAAIQTDAAVNHGNSGGPLVDIAGQVVGINAVIKSVADRDETAGNIGLAFAIPINHAYRVAQELIEQGRARRTVLGVELAGGAGSGVTLRDVVAAGPAAMAGLQPGDVLVSFAGRAVTEPVDLIALVRKAAPGEAVRIAYKRGLTSHEADVILAADVE